MRKILLLTLMFLNLSVLPSFGAEQQVIIDRLSQSEAEDLQIDIPDSVPQGFHSITIEVYDDNGTVSKKEIVFCKDELDVVQWDNLCPNLKLDVVPTPAPVEPDPVKAIKSGLQPYDPLEDPGTTQGLHLAAFAALAALSTTKRNERSDEKDEEQESLQSVSSGALRLLKNDPGRGDLSRTWVNRFTSESDYVFVSLSHRFNRFSPLLTRTIQDGKTVRAIVGSWASLLFHFGIFMGVVASFDSGFTSLPPTWKIVAGVMAVAIFDAFAGLIAGSIFLILALFTGHITNRPELLTVIGVLVLFFAPALLASSFRQFRRLVRNQDDLWERTTDYALGALLTFWVITKMVAAMNGLARLELPITSHGIQLGLLAAVLLVIRMGLEDLAVEQYPVRLSILHVEIRKPSHNQKIRTLIFKVVLFVVMASPFVGSNLNLILGALLFAIPQITSLSLENSLPKKKLYLPRGALKMVVMIFVMALASKLIQGSFSSPASFLKWSFVVMALPGFVFHYLDSITDAPKDDWKATKHGRTLYRVGGVAIFACIVLVVKGVDIASWLVN